MGRRCRGSRRDGSATGEWNRMLFDNRNSVAVVTDGTAVLGLGDIGPAAAMPVMEGKASHALRTPRRLVNNLEVL